MEFLAFKYKGEELGSPPDSYENIYYNPGTKSYVYYACSLVINDDNTYYLTGPDEGLKKYLDQSLQARKNHLDYNYSKKVGDTVYIMGKLVSFFDSGFQRAFSEFVSNYGFGKELYYTGTTGFIKVNSAQDVNILDAAYRKKRDEDIARWRKEDQAKK